MLFMAFLNVEDVRNYKHWANISSLTISFSKRLAVSELINAGYIELEIAIVNSHSKKYTICMGICLCVCVWWTEIDIYGMCTW